MDGSVPFVLLGEFAGGISDIQAEIDMMESGLTPKGVVADKDDLPATGEKGDMYLVSDEGYATYVWDDLIEDWAPKINDVATAAELIEALYS